jgi:hypothetical protein
MSRRQHAGLKSERRYRFQSKILREAAVSETVNAIDSKGFFERNAFHDE